jgi:hypothetical protein
VTTDTKVASNVKTFKNVYITGAPKAVISVKGMTKDSSRVYYIESIDDRIPASDKAKKEVYRISNDHSLSLDGPGTKLIIIDGKEVKSINNLLPSNIKSIDVIKSDAAKKEYGEKGKNGVIVITTKQALNGHPNNQ